MTKKFALILILISQLGCGVFSAPQPLVTLTLQPTSTLTPPVPLATKTPSPIPLLTGKRVDVPAGGFSLLVREELDVDIQGNTVGIFNKQRTLIISFVGTTYETTTNTLQDVIDDFLGELKSKGGEFTQSEPSQIFVNSIEGIYVDVTGSLSGAPIKGRAIAVSPKEGFIFFGLGISNLSSNDQLWEASGSFIFHELLDYIYFTNAQATDSLGGECKISTDLTYGYTETNPIEVGGDSFEGPSREEAYLGNLLGSNGESLSYEREGSIPTDTTILDGYRVTGPGIDVVLYLDEYNYSTPEAPLGFTCAGLFPLSQP